MGNAIKCSSSKSQYKGPTRRSRDLYEQQKQQHIPVMPCMYCNRSFSQISIWAHERKCIRNPRFIYLECENCCKMFNMLNYESHIEICEPQNSRNMSKNTSCVNEEEDGDDTKAYCDFCERPVGISIYHEHMKRCTKNPKNVRLPCPHCREKFPSDLMKKHKVFCMRNPDNMVAVCHGCDKEIRLRHYEKHLRECKDFSTRFSSKIEFECPICLCEITKSDSIRTLACRHKYHGECITDWSKQRNDCPVCRAKIKGNHNIEWILFSLKISKYFIFKLENRLNIFSSLVNNSCSFLYDSIMMTEEFIIRTLSHKLNYLSNFFMLILFILFDENVLLEIVKKTCRFLTHKINYQVIMHTIIIINITKYFLNLVLKKSYICNYKWV